MKDSKNMIDSKAYQSLKNVMIHWGFGETEASIYALLALSPRPMTAKEIAEQIGRAYSSVINEINKLIRHGMVTRNKGEKCYHYSAVIDVIKIIKNERRKVINLLSQTKEFLEEYHNNSFEEFKKHLEEAIRYLGEKDEGDRYVGGW